MGWARKSGEGAGHPVRPIRCVGLWLIWMQFVLTRLEGEWSYNYGLVGSSCSVTALGHWLGPTGTRVKCGFNGHRDCNAVLGEGSSTEWFR